MRGVDLQALIGGGDHQGLDLTDMKSHVNYAGGYHEDHPVIKGFWEVNLRAQDLSWDIQHMGNTHCTHAVCAAAIVRLNELRRRHPQQTGTCLESSANAAAHQ